MVTAIVVLSAAKETPVIIGMAVSITIALLAPKELVAPGLGNVNVAALPAASLIVPLFKASADVLA